MLDGAGLAGRATGDHGLPQLAVLRERGERLGLQRGHDGLGFARRKAERGRLVQGLTAPAGLPAGGTVVIPTGGQAGDRAQAVPAGVGDHAAHGLRVGPVRQRPHPLDDVAVDVLQRVLEHEAVALLTLQVDECRAGAPGHTEAPE